MKRNSMHFLLGIVLFLTACGAQNEGVSEAPGGGYGCFKDEKDRSGMCLDIHGDAETVKMGGTMLITITVTSEKDETGLLLSVYSTYSPDILKNIEFPKQAIIEDGYSKSWKFDIKEQQVLTFNGLITFSESGETDYQFLVSIFDPERGAQLILNSMLVAFREDIGRVYYSGEVPPPLDPALTPAYDEATRNFYLTQEAIATPSP